MNQACALGQTLAEHKIGLVYGGAKIVLHHKPIAILYVKGYFSWKVDQYKASLN